MSRLRIGSRVVFRAFCGLDSRPMYLLAWLRRLLATSYAYGIIPMRNARVRRPRDASMPRPRLGVAVLGVSLLVTGLQAGLMASPAAAQIYVDAEATGTGDGSSWTDAYPLLQDALAAAEQAGGGDVWVAAGTYRPDMGTGVTAGDRSASFVIPSGTAVYGRFAGTESTRSGRDLSRGTNITTLSGELQRDGDPSNNAYTVATLNGGLLDNVRIAHGNANGDQEQRRGGGVDATSGRIQNAWIQQNRATQGGGIYITGDTTLENVLINENQAQTASGVLVTQGASNITSATIDDDITIVDNDPVSAADDTQITNSALTGDTEVLTPMQRTVTFDVHEVGVDLYDGGDAPGELEQIRGTVDGQTYTANTTSGTGSVTFPTTTLTDEVRISVDDDDYLGTYMLNKTGTETAPDLTVTGTNRTTFPDEPDHQSNYDPETAGPNTGNGTAGNAVNGLANTDIALSNLDSSYEVRVIPTVTPGGNSFADETAVHLNQDRTKRFTSLDGYTQNQVYVLDTGSESEEFFTRANQAYAEIRSAMPVPMSDMQRIETQPLMDIYDDRNNTLITRFEEGGLGNIVNPRGNYIENTSSSFGLDNTYFNAVSETFSAKTGFGTINGAEPDNTMLTTPGNLTDDGQQAILSLYSMFSNSTIE